MPLSTSKGVARMLRDKVPIDKLPLSSSQILHDPASTSIQRPRENSGTWSRIRDAKYGSDLKFAMPVN